MAAATITEQPYRIATDSTGYIITKPGNEVVGYLSNVGSKTVYLLANGLVAGIHADGSQHDGEATLPPGCTLPVLKQYGTIAHVCAGSDTSVLQWIPALRM